MIYLDNAATTLQKPEAVAEAVKESFSYIGNAGRGANDASLFTSRLLYQTRKQIAELFHMTDGRTSSAAERVVFTMNATESLNIVIKGMFHAGDHVITTAMEHNSVLRPLYEMEAQGVELTILPLKRNGVISYDAMEQAVKENTKAIVCTHASNVTGNQNDIARIGAICEKHGLYFILDASQTAGAIEIDMEAAHISVLCFTGHKALYGPQGTGGICLADGVSVRPLLSGGSGIHSFEKEHPKQLPTALEAGTLNGHGIAGLHASLTWLKETGIGKIHEKEMQLKERFLQGIRKIPGIRIYGNLSERSDEKPVAGKEKVVCGEQKNICRNEMSTAIVSCNIVGLDASYVSDILAEEYGIATRAGAHCAPLIHEYFETREQGMVRFSFSYFNTEEEIDTAVNALREIAQDNRGHVTAYVGAGGKTSSIRERAKALCENGKKVLILTTTKMMLPKHPEIFAAYPDYGISAQAKEMDSNSIQKDSVKKDDVIFINSVKQILTEYGCCIAGTPIPDTGKFGMLPVAVMEELLYLADEILIEADGSAHMPVKAPAEWEPVLFPFMDEVVVLMGAHGIGKPLKEVCHRLPYAMDVLKCPEDKIVTKEDLELLMEEGYRKKIQKEYPKIKTVSCKIR